MKGRGAVIRLWSFFGRAKGAYMANQEEQQGRACASSGAESAHTNNIGPSYKTLGRTPSAPITSVMATPPQQWTLARAVRIAA